MRERRLNAMKNPVTDVHGVKAEWRVVYRVVYSRLWYQAVNSYTTINQTSVVAGACRALKVTLLFHEPHTLMMLLFHKMTFTLSMNDACIHGN